MGKNPLSIAVNPTTNKVYAVNYHSDSVSVIDGTTNDVVARDLMPAI
ncbi:MAG: hypothetical protein JO327_08950 [Nitrososphaeraceae archaeon]|nr:hypothetical protein [Nitrososphaeraceae archaeon]MBV9668242.1 hypothetical protein [Nitrososphaeraceae archaeon]